MSNLETLWKFQEADVECDKFEAGLRNSATYKRLSKLRSYLEDQKRILQKMNAAVEVRRQTIASTSERFDLYEKRYQEGMAKYENIDKENLEEISRYRKYFDQLAARVAQERKDFAQIVHVLEKEEAQLAEMRITIARARKEYDEVKAKYEEERSAAQGQLDELRAVAQKASETVEPPLLEAYRRVKRNHSVPVALVNGNKCGGCNMELPAVVARRLKEQDIVECDNCGRILYLQDNA